MKKLKAMTNIEYALKKVPEMDERLIKHYYCPFGFYLEPSKKDGCYLKCEDCWNLPAKINACY